MDLIETSFAHKSCQPLLGTRIFDVARVIQMNMEIALILAHIILLSPSVPEDPTVRPFFVQLSTILSNILFYRSPYGSFEKKKILLFKCIEIVLR